jgi:hypothetical protein
VRRKQRLARAQRAVADHAHALAGDLETVADRADAQQGPADGLVDLGQGGGVVLDPAGQQHSRRMKGLAPELEFEAVVHDRQPSTAPCWIFAPYRNA